MQNVEQDENILIDSRSQVSSFVVQADRIKSLETSNLDMTVQIQKLQSQLKNANTEKERLVKEKSELEARLRHEMAEKVKETRERIEEQMRDTTLANAEMIKTVEEMKQAQRTDKATFKRKNIANEKSI